MKLFLIEVAVLSLAALIVASYFFRSSRATVVLRKLRLAGWAYVALVIVMAAIQFLRSS